MLQGLRTAMATSVLLSLPRSKTPNETLNCQIFALLLYASVTAAQMPSERLMVIDFDILLLPSSIYYLSTFCLMKKASARADMMALKTLTAADMKV